jgi:SAM-dependent methyltransferase
MEPRPSTNRELRDERSLRVASGFYDVDAFKRGRPAIQPFEVDELGPLDAMRLVHLQCHVGLETLDIARLHPTVLVTGVDWSPRAIEAARRLAVEVRLAERADFVCADVYHAVDAVARRFDVVYTGKGALRWLPDLDRWASVVHELLDPGGFLYLSEFHPVASVLAPDAPPVPERDYFSTEPIVSDDAAPDHTERATPAEHNAGYEWQHPIGRVITAVLRAGLVLELFHEWDFTLLDQFRYLTKGSDGRRRWQGPGTLPLMYSLKARRPAR